MLIGIPSINKNTHIYVAEKPRARGGQTQRAGRRMEAVASAATVVAASEKAAV